MLQKLSSAVFLVVIAAPLCAQDSSLQAKKAEWSIDKTDGRFCEVNAALLDALADLARECNARIFLISRPGVGETRPRLGYRRLFNARTRLASKGSEKSRRLDPARIITAEGERVKEQGRLEFYLDNELFLVATFPRNADFCVACCEMDGRYYGRGKTD